MSESLSWPLVTSIVTSVLLVLAVLAFTLRAVKIEKKIDRLMEMRQNQGLSRNELQAMFEPLRSAIGNVPAETERRVVRAIAQRPSSEDVGRIGPTRPIGPISPIDPPVPPYDEPQPSSDALAQLLIAANRIVQESSTTLEAFRASTKSFVRDVAPWPGSGDGTPLAFIVEHGGACYAVPNVVKPARLPQEWFNRIDFGVNDEIQRVVSLPRLRRRSGGYDVQEPGVFRR